MLPFFLETEGSPRAREPIVSGEGQEMRSAEQGNNCREYGQQMHRRNVNVGIHQGRLSFQIIVAGFVLLQ